MFESKCQAWTRRGFQEAVKMILTEKNMLFESLGEKLVTYPELNEMLRTVLFTGKQIAYNLYEPSMNIATMFGFVKNQKGNLAIANRIFETWLYDFYLSEDKMHKTEIYTASVQNKNQFIIGGHLNVKLLLEKFVEHFHDLYSDSGETFLEDIGRKYFLLYLCPIINEMTNIKDVEKEMSEYKDISRRNAQWIWLDAVQYPELQINQQYTSWPKTGHDCVADFRKEFSFLLVPKQLTLYVSGDAVFRLWMNSDFVGQGPASAGGDFLLKGPSPWYYANKCVSNCQVVGIQQWANVSNNL